MRYRHLVPVDRVGACDRATVPIHLVGDELVPGHVPVGPALRGTAALEAEHSAVELPSGFDVVHGNGEVKGWRRRGRHIRTIAG